MNVWLMMLIQSFVTALFLLILSYGVDVLRTLIFASRYDKYLKERQINLEYIIPKQNANSSEKIN